MARTKESEAVVWEKYTQTTYQYPSKPELGFKSVFHFDRSKNPNGAWKVDHTPPKGYTHPKVKVQKGKAYNGQPVVMVFKTSNNSNAKTKIKVWQNESIDYIATADKLPGVPDKAVILELAVGESFIDKYNKKYGFN